MTIDTEPIKHQVLAKLNGRMATKLVGLEEVEKQLLELLTGTVTSREGNSCMILGPRSTGKTSLVMSTLSTLTDKYKDQFITVNLSGFVQLDDKMALREIARQLNTLVEDDDKTVAQRGLSHTLFQILDTFQSNSNCVAVLFILEELDKFAKHARQTLLYNLLELSQTSTQIGIAVVGISTRINTRDMLEKRVLSRFSQRVYHTKRAESLDIFWQMAKTKLCADADDLSSGVARQWNDHIEALFQGDLSKLLEFVFYTTKDMRQLNASLISPVAQALPFIDPQTIEAPEPMAHTALFVEGLSELELALLICAARVDTKAAPLNFQLAFDEYTKQANKLNMERQAATSGIQGTSRGLGRYRIWTRDASLAAWERLETMQLVVPLSLTTEVTTYKADVSLVELRDMIGTSHSLYPWTRI